MELSIHGPPEAVGFCGEENYRGCTSSVRDMVSFNSTNAAVKSDMLLCRNVQMFV